MELSDLCICTFHVVRWELHTDVNLTAQYGALRSPYMHINCAMSTTCWHEFHCAIWSSQISVYVHSTLCSENYMPTQISLCNMEFSDLRICTFHTVQWDNPNPQYGVLRSPYICLWRWTLWWEFYFRVNVTMQYGVLRSLYICLFALRSLRWELHVHVNVPAKYGVLRSPYICLFVLCIALWELYIHVNVSA